MSPTTLVLFNASSTIKAQVEGSSRSVKEKGVAVSGKDVPPSSSSPTRLGPPASRSTPLPMLATSNSLAEVAAEVDDDIPLQSLLHGLKRKKGSTSIEFPNGISTARLNRNSFIIPPPPPQ